MKRVHAGYAKRCFIASMLLITFFSVHSQTTYYSRNGATAPRNWDEADSWTLSSDGSGTAAAIPGRNDNVVILNGHNIIVDNVGDNGSTSVSATGLGQANVGTFPNAGVGNFYQTGNIYVKSGGTLTFSARAMLGGTTTVDGTLTASGDLIITGRIEIIQTASFSVGDDFILTGFSEALIYNTTTSSDDLYMDHTDAQLCGNNTVDLGDAIQYLNGATSDQICSDMNITGCGTCPTTGTGANNIGTDQNLLAGGSIWRYLDDGTDQGTAWYGTGFDDSGWATGNAELGYGDGDETTTVSFGADANNKYTTTYFRTTFFVNDRTDYTKIIASINFDDGVVVYLNGTEVIRSNMPTGTITSSTFAAATKTNENVEVEFELSVFDIVNGTNYVAVEIHQANLTSSDISFDMALSGSYSTTLIDAGETWNYLDDGTDQGTAWTGTSFDDSGWSSGDAELGYGDGDETTTVSFGPDTNNKYTTTYFRKSFDNTDASVFAIKVGLRRDDGAVVYLNGNEIIRDNMPTGTITSSTFASGAVGGGDETTYFSFEVDASDLIVGTNVIAVEVHQANLTSSDISFDLTLELVQPGALLPVTLIDFNGESNSSGIRLNWSTASELNNDFYLVERSRDGQHFNEIARVKGAGTTNETSSYSLVDFNPATGLNFYRLTQFDFDGQHETFETIYVQHGESSLDEKRFYPNPTSSIMYIRSENAIVPNSIALHDLSGTAYSIDVEINGNVAKLDLSTLSTGLYIVTMSQGNGTITRVISRQ